MDIVKLTKGEAIEIKNKCMKEFSNAANTDSTKTEVKKKFYPKRPPTQTGHLQKD